MDRVTQTTNNASLLESLGRLCSALEGAAGIAAEESRGTKSMKDVTATKPLQWLFKLVDHTPILASLGRISDEE